MSLSFRQGHFFKDLLRWVTWTQIILQILNGLDKGSAYALIALGLTLIFGTLGVVNFAHGALFMIGAFCAVTLSRFSAQHVILTRPKQTFWASPSKSKCPMLESGLARKIGAAIIDWSVPLAILFSSRHAVIGFIMERGLIKHFLQTAPCGSDPRDLWPWPS